MTLSEYVRNIWNAITGKAMADLHPEFSEREHIASFASDAVIPSASYSYLSALGDYQSHVWVRKAITVIANNLSPLPLQVLRADKVMENHALAQLLANVNNTQSSVELWQQWTVDMLLGGEEGWELVKDGRGNYVEIWARQPHTITIHPDPAKKRYFQVAGYTIDDGSGDAYDLPPDELLFFKFYNPRNPWRGLAPITAVRMAISIDQFAQVWSRLFFSKGARPDYAVIAPEGTTKSEREEMEIKLAAKFGGADNWFKPIVLEQGVTDVKPLDFRPRDLEWVQQRELSREEIGALFGVPDEIMGWGRDTYENFDTALRVLWSLTILALTGMRDTHLSEYFRRVGALKADERIATDTSKVAALKHDLTTKIEQVTKLWQMGVPFNIASEHVGLGLAIDDGDVGYLPANVFPVGMSTDNAATAEDESQKPKALIAPKTKIIAYDSAEHRAAWERFVKRTDPHEKKLGRVVADLLRAQQADVLKRLRAGKAIRKDAQDVADNPFDREAWGKEFREKVKPVLQEIIADAGEAALDDIGVGIAFDVLEPAVLEFLNERNQRFAQAVNETTWQQLKDSLNEGLENGESISDLATRVESVMGNRIRSSGETIARTEVIGASNGGTILAWQQSDVVEAKTWLAALDDRTRETHIEAHGQTVKLDADFHVGAGSGPHPGAIGLAEEDINCRCSITAVLTKSARAQVRHSVNGHGRVRALFGGEINECNL